MVYLTSFSPFDSSFTGEVLKVTGSKFSKRANFQMPGVSHQIKVHLPVQRLIFTSTHLFSYWNFANMSLALVWLLSWMAMDTLERRGAWILMTPSGTSDCQGGNMRYILLNSMITLKRHENQWHSKLGKHVNMTRI